MEVQSIASQLMYVVQEQESIDFACTLSQVRLAAKEECVAILERHTEPLPVVNRCLHEVLQEKFKDVETRPAVPLNDPSPMVTRPG